MFLERGIVFTHETVRLWEEPFAPMLTEKLRRRRKGLVGESWYVDETYIKVKSKWCYLYCAIDKTGELVDCRFSEKRDMDAAKAFFREALAVTGVQPDGVTTDGHDSYPRAIKEELGEDTKHRTSRYLNNLIEQNHRGIKERYKPMRGFKTMESAALFSRTYDELRNFLKATKRNEKKSLAERRQHHLTRVRQLDAWLTA